MYYISGVVKNKIKVVDTSDNAEDLLTTTEVLQAERMGYSIKGLIHSNGRVYFCPYSPSILEIDNLQIGSPVRVRLSSGLDFKQTLYAGKHLKNGKLLFYFYDDSGVDGYFCLSSEYITKNNISFDFKNDTIRVATLINRFKDSGGF